MKTGFVMIGVGLAMIGVAALMAWAEAYFADRCPCCGRRR
jgi:hypothetical protein